MEPENLCVFCNDGEEGWGWYNDTEFLINKDILKANNGQKKNCEIPINFCPFCGRKLE